MCLRQGPQNSGLHFGGMPVQWLFCYCFDLSWLLNVLPGLTLSSQSQNQNGTYTAWPFYNLYFKMTAMLCHSFRIAPYSPTSPQARFHLMTLPHTSYWEVDAIRQAVFHLSTFSPASLYWYLPLCLPFVPMKCPWTYQCLHLTFFHEACIHALLQPGFSFFSLRTSIMSILPNQ